MDSVGIRFSKESQGVLEPLEVSNRGMDAHAKQT